MAIDYIALGTLSGGHSVCTVRRACSQLRDPLSPQIVRTASCDGNDFGSDVKKRLSDHAP